MWPDASARRAPLGLPPGSVRAILTLLVLGVVVAETVHNRRVDVFWSNTLLIVLAHYFTARRFVKLPKDQLERLQNEGVLERDTQPLFLPKNTIRFLIVATFIGLGVYLYTKGRLTELNWKTLESLDVFLIVLVYLAGVMWHGLRSLVRRGAEPPPAGRFADIQAAIVLLVMGAVAATYFFDRADLLPEGAQKAALALVLFYFGSR